MKLRGTLSDFDQPEKESQEAVDCSDLLEASKLGRRVLERQHLSADKLRSLMMRPISGWKRRTSSLSWLP